MSAAAAGPRRQGRRGCRSSRQSRSSLDASFNSAGNPGSRRADPHPRRDQGTPLLPTLQRAVQARQEAAAPVARTAITHRSDRRRRPASSSSGWPLYDQRIGPVVELLADPVDALLGGSWVGRGVPAIRRGSATRCVRSARRCPRDRCCRRTDWTTWSAPEPLRHKRDPSRSSSPAGHRSPAGSRQPGDGSSTATRLAGGHPRWRSSDHTRTLAGPGHLLRRRPLTCLYSAAASAWVRVGVQDDIVENAGRRA